MAILRERKVWSREPSGTQFDGLKLTAEQATNVRRALRFLSKRLGGNRELAQAMGYCTGQIKNVTSKNKAPTLPVAVHAARIADVSIDDVLRGRWPIADACPYCGRSD